MYQEFKFVCSYLQDKEDGLCVYFIKPYDGEIDDKTIFSDVLNLLHIGNIYNSLTQN